MQCRSHRRTFTNAALERLPVGTTSGTGCHKIERMYTLHNTCMCTQQHLHVAPYQGALSSAAQDASACNNLLLRI